MEFTDGIIRDAEYARSLHMLWEPRWQGLAEYLLPEMADFTVTVSPGEERGRKIINSEGRLANRECAEHVSGFLMGEGTAWFDLRIQDPRVEKDPVVRGWLDEVKRVLYGVFNSPGSGFGTSLEPTFHQITTFGNGPLYIGVNKGGWPIFRPEFLGNCSIWTDDDNRPVALFREYEQTAFGLLQQFGKDALPHSVTSVLDKEPQRKFKCVHATRPRMDTDPFDLAGKPWVEAYILKDGKHQLGPITGYWEFPWIFPRWKVSPNSMYGYGPGSDAIQDVRMLQKIEGDIVKNVDMSTNPMWRLEDEGGVSPRINQKPGGKVYARMNQNGHWNAEPLFPVGSVRDAIEQKASIVRTIKSLFYLDAFKMVEKVTEKGAVAHMSATEWAGRLQEQLRGAGPKLARLRAELLFPLISRTSRILMRNGKLPEPPWQLRGSPIHPEYVSPLAIAQRAGEGSAVLQLIGDLIPLAQLDLRALDVLNIPRAGQVLGRSRHVLTEVLNTPQEIAAKEQARADAAQQQAAIEQAGTMATASKDNAQALESLRGA